MPSATSSSKSMTRVHQSRSNSRIGTGGILRVWHSVRTSNSSSKVPKPPGKATSALARIAKWSLRIAK
jgi:hypothetical protein